MANKRRVHQIAERIREILATELIRAADPRFMMVTVTSVIVSADLRIAKIYWVVSGALEKKRQAAAAFERAGGFLKRAVGDGLGIRFTPDLKFFYDETLDTVDEVDKIFRKIDIEREERSEALPEEVDATDSEPEPLPSDKDDNEKAP